MFLKQWKDKAFYHKTVKTPGNLLLPLSLLVINTTRLIYFNNCFPHINPNSSQALLVPKAACASFKDFNVKVNGK